MNKNDTRHLKRDTNGSYRTGGGKVICDICSLQYECSIKPQNTCQYFVPALGFYDRTGMLKVFNTMRVGKAWTERLVPGQTIGLWCPIEKDVFGYAEVLSFTSGPISRMIVEHAEHNHLMLDANYVKAQRQLLVWLKQQYGPRIIHEKTQLTAIYLRRTRRPPSAPNIQGCEALWTSESSAASAREDYGDGGRN